MSIRKIKRYNYIRRFKFNKKIKKITNNTGNSFVLPNTPRWRQSNKLRIEMMRKNGSKLPLVKYYDEDGCPTHRQWLRDLSYLGYEL